MKMRTRGNRVLSIILCLVMIFSLVLIDNEVVLADDDPTTGLIYTISSGQATITGFTAPDGFDGNLVIPAMLGGASVISIEAYALQSNDSLTSISIPIGVVSIGESFGAYCNNLTAINVDEGNLFYKSAAGMLFSKDGKVLIKCPAGQSGSIVIPDGVLSIEDYAFSYCENLTDLSIPSTVTSIGNTSFYYCRGLINLVIPDSVLSIGYNAFDSCSSLNNITLSGNLESIASYAFENCDGLTSIDIPGSVTSIGDGVFLNCNNLTSINVPEENAFYKSVSGTLYSEDGKTLIKCPEGRSGSMVIPGGVLKIEDYAFYFCEDLISLSLPDSVTSIGTSAFTNCWNLTTLTIPGQVISIGDSAFNGCGGLSSITIPSSVTSIGKNVFAYCYRLSAILVDSANSTYQSYEGMLFSKTGKTLFVCPGNKAGSVSIPNGVTSIAEGAFWYCIHLTDISIPDSVTSIGIRTFWYCRDLTSITIPGTVTSIGAEAFYGCSGLTSAILSSGMTAISDGMFYSCNNLNNVTIPRGVTSIGNEAFYACSSLHHITIPDTVNSIGRSAFYLYAPDQVTDGCIHVTFEGQVASIDTNAFAYSAGNLSDTRTTLFVIPAGTKAYYESLLDSSVMGLTTVLISETSAFLVTFFDWDSTLLKTEVVAADASATPPEVPGRDGYRLTGWSVDYDHVLNDLIVYAQYTENSFVDLATGLNYSLASGGATITGFDQPSGFNGSLNIPATLGGMSVVGIDYEAFAFNTSLTSVTIPDSVTEIADYAFSNCTKLSSVLLPDCITTIESGTFHLCTSLTGVAIPVHVTSIEYGAFSNCTKLTNIEFPDGLLSIKERAFANCTSLGSITIPGSVNYFHYTAVENCTSLTNITVDAANTVYKSVNGLLYSADGTNLILCPEGKQGVISISAGVTSINAGAFFNCSGLTNVTIPVGVLDIGTGAFRQCTSLAGITIPDGVIEIGEYAFLQCSSLASITIPGSVTSIGASTFGKCTALTAIHVAAENLQFKSENGILYSKDGTTLMKCPEGKSGAVTIPAGVTRIGVSAFADCHNITAATLPASVNIVDTNAFSGCSKLTGIVIPDGVTSIKANVFEYCTALSSVTIPDSVTSIEAYAFYRCQNLTAIIIPNYVETIEEGAFFECLKLAAITIPASVTSIGDGSFSGCPLLPAIGVAAENSEYKSIDGVLYSKDGTTLIKCPEGKTGSVSISGVVTDINNLFYNCASLTAINVDPANTIYQSIDGVLYSKDGKTLMKCPEGKSGSVTIPGSVTAIWYTFENCAALTAINVAAENLNYQSIDGILYSKDGKTIMKCPEGKTGNITISASVTTIYESAFANCQSILAFNVNLANTVYKSIDGILYSKDGRTLLECPDGKAGSVAIPDQVTQIGTSAFTDCVNITGVTIPASVTLVNYYAFTGCLSLSSAIFAGNAPDMGEAVFDNCASDFSIYYSPDSTGFTTPTWYGYPASCITSQMVSVTFNSMGGTAVTDKTTNYNSVITAPAAPTRTGYTFAGWYTSSSYTTPWVFASNRVTANITLYARWLKTSLTGLVAASAGYGSVKLTWTASSGANGYLIYRSTSSTGVYTLVTTLASGTTNSYTNTGLLTGTTFYYKIRAYSTIGSGKVYGSYSPVVYAKPIPAVPGSFKASSYGYSIIKLTWTQVTGASGYQVYRATSSTGVYSLLTTLTSGATISYMNTGLTTGRTYYYKIRAYRTVGTTRVYSNFTVAASTKPVPAVPGSFAVVKYTSASIKTSWTAVTGATGYEVYRATSSTGTYSWVKTTASASFINTGLTAGRTYYYKVRAYRLVGTTKVYGAFTTVKYAKT